MEQSLENVLANLVRVGTVSSVDAGQKKARVIFKDKDNMVSGWLHVIQLSGAASTEPGHNHYGTTIAAWMPKVNDTVLVIYLPVFNGDGFVLGAI